MLDREFYENFGALKKGVVLPSCSVDESLAAMPDDEARAAKRKWRKLCRKAKKRIPWNANSKQAVKRQARHDLSEMGKGLMKPKSKEDK